jgi:hypothetical protein
MLSSGRNSRFGISQTSPSISRCGKMMFESLLFENLVIFPHNGLLVDKWKVYGKNLIFIKITDSNLDGEKI